MSKKFKLGLVFGSIGLAVIITIIAICFLTIGKDCNHQYFLYKKESTCTENGYEKYQCIYCNDIKSENIILSNHKDTYITDLIASTCSTKGKTEGVFCNTCNSWVVAPDDVEKTAHDYEIIDVLSTCVSQGYTYNKCINCGDNYKDDFKELLDHSIGYITVKYPTCTEKGLYEGKCETCDNTFYKEIDLIEHDPSLIVMSEELCGDKPVGKVKCSMCEKTISSFGHSYNSEFVSSTCENDGYELLECVNCDASHRIIIPATGHIKGKEIIEYGSCYTSDYLYFECLLCNEIYYEEKLHIYNHQFEYIIEDNFYVKKCTKCNYESKYELQEDTCVVSFVTNCDINVTDQIINCGDAIECINLKRDGYYFEGWYYDELFTTKYLAQLIYEDTTLYACFSKDIIEAEYDDNNFIIDIETNYTFDVFSNIELNENNLDNYIKVCYIDKRSLNINVNSIGNNIYNISIDKLEPGAIYKITLQDDISFVDKTNKSFMFKVKNEYKNHQVYQDDVIVVYNDEVACQVNEGEYTTLLFLNNTKFNINDKIVILGENDILMGIHQIYEISNVNGYYQYKTIQPKIDHIFKELDISSVGETEIVNVNFSSISDESMIQTFENSTMCRSIRKAATLYEEKVLKYKYKYDDMEFEPIKRKTPDESLEVGFKVTIKFKNNDYEYVKIVLYLIDTVKFNGNYNLSLENANVVLDVNNSFNIGISIIKGNSYSSIDETTELTKKEFMRILTSVSLGELDESKESTVNEEIALIPINLMICGIPTFVDLHVGFNWDIYGQFGIQGSVLSNHKIIASYSILNGFSLDTNHTSNISISAIAAGKIEAYPYIGLGISFGINNVLSLGCDFNVGPKVEAGGLCNITYHDGNLDTANGWYLNAGIEGEIVFNVGIYGHRYEKNLYNIYYEMIDMGEKDIPLYFTWNQDEFTIHLNYREKVDLNDLIDLKVVTQNFDNLTVVEKKEKLNYSLAAYLEGNYKFVTFKNNQITFFPNDDTVYVIHFFVTYKSLFIEFPVTFVIDHTHNYDSVESIEPNCTTKGYVNKKCSCGSEATEYFDALGHLYENGVCTRCGINEEEFTDGLVFAKGETGYIVVGYNGSDSNVIIPSKYKGDYVVSIGEWAFAYNDTIRNISIPNSIQEIGVAAFSDCNNLVYYYYDNCKYLGNKLNNYLVIVEIVDTNETFSINPSTQIIMYEAFYGLYTDYIQIPDTVVSIGYNAFACSQIGNIVMSNSIKVIDECAFYRCTNLTRMELPDTIEIIRKDAFLECNSLEYNEYENCRYLGNENNPYLVLVDLCDASTSAVYINKYAKVIYDGCLSYDTISEFIVDESNKYFKSIDWHIYNKNGTELIQYALGRHESTFSIPEGVIKIGNNAFSGSTYLTSVSMPNSVKYIGKNAFYMCSELKTVNISDNLEIIDSNAFYGCTFLESIINLKNIIYIGTSAFSENYYLEDIYFGENLVAIGAYAFFNENIMNPYRSLDFPDSLQVIGRYAFYKNKIEYLTLPKNLVRVEDSTFYNTSIDHLYLNDKLEYIGSNAFAYIDIYTNLVLPNSMKYIGSRAFFNVDLITIEVPESIEYIGSEVFKNGLRNYNNFNGMKYIGNKNNPYEVLVEVTDKNLSAYELHSDTKVIASSVFRDLSKLKNIVLPNGLEVIGESAFYCSGLEELILPDSVYKIYSWAFSYTSISEIELNHNITVIEKNTFYNCDNLSEVIIPTSVNYIGNNAFSSCTNLSSIYIPSNVIAIGEKCFEYSDKITIYCETKYQPNTWSLLWNNRNYPVEWGIIFKN